MGKRAACPGVPRVAFSQGQRSSAEVRHPEHSSAHLDLLQDLRKASRSLPGPRVHVPTSTRPLRPDLSQARELPTGMSQGR